MGAYGVVVTSVFDLARAGIRTRGFLPRAREGEESTPFPPYIQRMRKMFVALAITALMGLIFLVAGTAQNHGCLPWKQALHTGGSAFSEGDRGHTYCK